MLYVSLLSWGEWVIVLVIGASGNCRDVTGRDMGLGLLQYKEDKHCICDFWPASSLSCPGDEGLCRKKEEGIG
jgi:hypothetical protein